MGLAVIAAAGFAVRVIYLFTLAAPIAGIGDSAYYYYTSNLIVQGQGYTEPFRLMFYQQHTPTALHPPLWPAVLAVLSVFTAPTSGVGQLGGAALALHRILGCLVGALVVVLVGLLGRRVGGPRVGLLAAALAAFYPRFVMLDTSLSNETLFAAVVGVLLLAAYRFVDRPRRAGAVGLGVLVGLSALTREEGLLFVPVLLIPLAWRVGRPTRRGLLALTLLGTLVVVAPWTVRNYIAFHEFVPVANSGAVIAGANCHITYYGPQIGSWQGCYHDPHPSSNEAVEANRQRSAGISYAERHPARAVLVAGVRLLRSWSLFAPNSYSAENRTVLWVGTVIYYALLIAACYALVALHRRGRSIMILIAPAIVVSLAAIFGDGLERLRYDAEVPLLALASWTLVRLWARTATAHGPRALRRASSPMPPAGALPQPLPASERRSGRPHR
jgi:4-amino-4-deoxy-L-arabinose transferase-like glycosyltransferase